MSGNTPPENGHSTITDSILLTIEEAVTIYDQDFRLVAWNEKYAEMGITPVEHIRKGLHIEDTYRYAAEFGVFGSGNPEQIAQQRIEMVYSGNSPDVEDLHGADGKIIEIRRYFLPGIGVAAVFSDVTHTRRLTNKARRTAELELLARVAAGICHDFNNVLHAVVSNVQIAAMHNESPFIDNALEAAFTGAKLAKSIIALARPNDLKSTDPIDAVAAVKRSANWIQSVLRDNVSLQLSGIGESGRAMIEVNEGEFSAALANLIINAHDALQREGTINIDVDFVDEWLSIKVIDDGPGIPNDIIEQIEFPYFTTKGDAGVGLGLVEVRRFAEASGGYFGIESELGKGTIAQIKIPLQESEESDAKPDSETTEQTELLCRVLLVEDRPDLNAPIQIQLEKLGCTTVAMVSAESVISTIQAAGSSFFDIVISDIDLSGTMDGLAFVRWLSKYYPSKPTIILTGKPSSEIDSSDPLPCRAILQKPILLDELLIEIRRAFREHHEDPESGWEISRDKTPT